MTNITRLVPPLDEKMVSELRSGQHVMISGKIYTARDATHRRLINDINRGNEPPVDLKGQVIYYVGPTPAKPGQVIGSAGPTTSGRMDLYTPQLLSLGLKGMIGKGLRSEKVLEAMKKYKAVYFAAVGGAGALISRRILDARIVAYPELAYEAFMELVVKDFPVIVINDVLGGDLYRRRLTVKG